MSKQQVTVSIETITPETAQLWLESNANNRVLKHRHIASIARDITNGNWVLDGNSIKWSGDELIDGQHRLLAIVAADLPVQTLVVRGVRPSARLTMDGHAKRTLSDQFRMAGVPSYKHAATAITYIIRYQRDRGTNPYEVTPSEAMQFLDGNPEIHHSIRVSHAVYSALRLSHPKMAALHFLFSEAAPTSDADEFFHLLASGDGLPADDPIAVLRKRLIEDLAAPASRRLPVRYREAIVIKAWNAWMRGDRIKVLKWVPGGTTKEKFPEILGRVE